MLYHAHAQINDAYCGPASTVTVLNTLGVGQPKQTADSGLDSKQYAYYDQQNVFDSETEKVKKQVDVREEVMSLMDKTSSTGILPNALFLPRECLWRSYLASSQPTLESMQPSGIAEACPCQSSATSSSQRWLHPQRLSSVTSSGRPSARGAPGIIPLWRRTMKNMTPSLCWMSRGTSKMPTSLRLAR